MLFLMKTYFSAFKLYLITLLAIVSIDSMAQTKGIINFNDDWLFTLSDAKNYSLTTYNPKNWTSVDLPHDWSIAMDFSKDLEGCTAFMPGGIGWYSKNFKTPINENEKCYIIFDGVYNNAEFWINGIRIGNHPYGYAPIYYDLTELLAPEGQENRISVRVDHSRYADSRWYTGSGIYRNVQLLIADKLHIPVWGTFITTPVATAKKAEINLEIEIKNEYAKTEKGFLISEILDAKGKLVKTIESKIILNPQQQKTVTQHTTIIKPNLWGIENPYLYTVKSYIQYNTLKTVPRITKLGIRAIHFDKDKGFYLNNKHVKVKGVCLHHDAGMVGAAVPKDVWKRKLLKLKEGGTNAIRTAHNPASDEFLDLCDELGLLVQNEFYDEWDLPKDKRFNMHDKEVDYISRGHSEHFQQWAETDLKNTMKSSRNHPSIFQWSIGNEIEWTYPGNRGATGIFKETNRDDKIDWTLWRTKTPPHTPEQVRQFWKDFPKQTFNIGKTAKKLATWTRELDITRFVTANCILPTSSFETGYTDALDVVGYSYKPHKYDYFKKTYPNTIMMGTENVPRWYEWKAAVEREYIAGVFLWTGIDYLGEKKARHWPKKAAEGGLLDVAGFARGSFYKFKAFWRDDIPVLTMYTQTEKESIYKVNKQGKVVEKKKDYWKLAPRRWQNVNPYWNYNEGTPTIVEIYSNCEAVELFQDGKSLGKQYLKDQIDSNYKWAVNYTKGKLVAKGIKGTQTIKKTLKTINPAVRIRLKADKTKIKANNTDVVHVTAQLVDSKGREVKHQENKITFQIEGEYKFLGTDCGDTAKLQNFKSKTVSTTFGQCLLAIQATKKTSKVVITAKGMNGIKKAQELIIVVE